MIGMVKKGRGGGDYAGIRIGTMRMGKVEERREGRESEKWEM